MALQDKWRVLEVDASFDVWSAGMTLIELLTDWTTLRVDDQTGLSHVALYLLWNSEPFGGSRTPLPR